MSATVLGSFDEILRDLFPLPGEPVKQWVLDRRAARAELVATGERIRVPDHEDNTGLRCRNVGGATLVHDCEHHDCCLFCNELAEVP